MVGNQPPGHVEVATDVDVGRGCGDGLNIAVGVAIPNGDAGVGGEGGHVAAGATPAQTWAVTVRLTPPMLVNAPAT